MSLRRNLGLWGCAVAALLAGGCVLAPAHDLDWAGERLESADQRLVYARSRVVETGRNVWIGRAVAGAGAVLLATFVTLWHDSEYRHDDGHDVAKDKRFYSWLGGGSSGVLLFGVGYAGYHEEMRDQWHLMALDQQARGGTLPEGPAPGGPSAEPAPPPAPAPAPAARVLYLERGSQRPEWATGVEVQEVSGPGDPALAAVAQRLSAVRLPLLVIPGEGGAPPTYAMGWAAVRDALAKK